jgi:hypothetical protein
MLRSAALLTRVIPCLALFFAAKTFNGIVPQGGVTPVCPDFFIGGHAVIVDAAGVARDAARRYGYFPGVVLITGTNPNAIFSQPSIVRAPRVSTHKTSIGKAVPGPLTPTPRVALLGL